MLLHRSTYYTLPVARAGACTRTLELRKQGSGPSSALNSRMALPETGCCHLLNTDFLQGLFWPITGSAAFNQQGRYCFWEEGVSPISASRSHYQYVARQGLKYTSVTLKSSRTLELIIYTVKGKISSSCDILWSFSAQIACFQHSQLS